MPRTFLGWSLPRELREEIAMVVHSLQDELPRASWTRTDNYHITFAFLGEQEESVIERLGAALEELETSKAAPTSLGQAGVFPNRRRPRVGWIGLSEPEGVAAIGDRVIEILRGERIGFDEKPFRPHLTLVRLKVGWKPADVERFLGAWGGLAGYPLLVDSVTLFESWLEPAGARHLVRTRVSLEG